MVRITKIIENQDMRGVHKLRKRMRTLKKGECLVAFNKSKNIARIIDHLGGVHTYYTEQGVVFNMDSLRDLVYDSFYIDITVGATVRKKAQHLRRVA
jgi:hypothetical protein